MIEDVIWVDKCWLWALFTGWVLIAAFLSAWWEYEEPEWGPADKFVANAPGRIAAAIVAFLLLIGIGVFLQAVGINIGFR